MGERPRDNGKQTKADRDNTIKDKAKDNDSKANDNDSKAAKDNDSKAKDNDSKAKDNDRKAKDNNSRAKDSDRKRYRILMVLSFFSLQNTTTSKVQLVLNIHPVHLSFEDSKQEANFSM